MAAAVRVRENAQRQVAEEYVRGKGVATGMSTQGMAANGAQASILKS